MSEELFRIEALRLSFKEVEALRGVDLSAGSGSVIGLVGRNAAGKSTLLRCLVGQLRPTSGRVRLFGVDPGRLTVDHKRRLGYLTERVVPFPWARVEDLWRVCAPLYPRWDDDLGHELLRRFDIDPRRGLKTLSLGQQRAVGLLLALCPRPELLVLDEPAANLDVVTRRAFLDQVLGLIADAGSTVILSSHLLSDIERVADRLVVLHQGKILLDRDADELRESVCRVRLVFGGEAPVRGRWFDNTADQVDLAITAVMLTASAAVLVLFRPPEGFGAAWCAAHLWAFAAAIVLRRGARRPRWLLSAVAGASGPVAGTLMVWWLPGVTPAVLAAAALLAAVVAVALGRVGRGTTRQDVSEAIRPEQDRTERRLVGVTTVPDWLAPPLLWVSRLGTRPGHMWTLLLQASPIPPMVVPFLCLQSLLWAAPLMAPPEGMLLFTGLALAVAVTTMFVQPRFEFVAVRPVPLTHLVGPPMFIGLVLAALLPAGALIPVSWIGQRQVADVVTRGPSPPPTGDEAAWGDRYAQRLDESAGLRAMPAGALIPAADGDWPPLRPSAALVAATRRAVTAKILGNCLLSAAWYVGAVSLLLGYLGPDVRHRDRWRSVWSPRPSGHRPRRARLAALTGLALVLLLLASVALVRGVAADVVPWLTYRPAVVGPWAIAVGVFGGLRMLLWAREVTGR